MSKIKTVFLIVCLGLFVFTQSCSEVIKLEFDPCSKYINRDNLSTIREFTRPTEGEELFLTFADNAAKGLMNVNKKLQSFPYNINDINWDAVYSDSPNTFQLYLQSLSVVGYLSFAYEETGQEQYLELSKNIIISWLHYQEDKPKNPYVWDDHSTSMRTENLVYFLSIYTNTLDIDQEFFIKVYDSLIQHGYFLAEDINYIEKHNHGFFMDRALMYLSKFLIFEKSSSWFEKSVERMKGQIDYAFNEEMIHVENSTSYYFGMIDNISKVLDFMQPVSVRLTDTLFDFDLLKSKNKFLHFIKPNGSYVEIGDTNSIFGETNLRNMAEISNDEYLSYAFTKGKIGEVPADTSLFLPLSGYYMSRSNWDPESDYILFKAGFASETHKHADDISIIYFTKGYDIFVDPGYYNYNYGDPIREYLRSAKGHNTIIVDNKSYLPVIEYKDKTGFAQFDFNDNYDYVLGYNNIYDGVEIDRHLYNINNNAFIIFDDISSSTSHEYSQLFQLSESISIVGKTDNYVKLKIADTDYYVTIYQLSDDITLDIKQGGVKNEEFGYISRSFNKYVFSQTLKFNKFGKSTQFITLIQVEDSAGEVDGINNIDFFPGSTFIVKENGKETYEIELKERNRLTNIVEIECDKDSCVLLNNGSGNGNLEYAWYIYEKESHSLIEKIDFSKNKSIKYIFPKNDVEYLISAYIKNNLGEKKQDFVAEIRYKNNMFNYYIPQGGFTPKLHNIKIEKGTDGRYSYQIDFDYFWYYEFWFYIYKDGLIYKKISSNDNLLTIHYDEPGIYTVKYYVKYLGGEKQGYFNEVRVGY